VPPFKAFIAFAQDLIAGPVLGEVWPMTGSERPSAQIHREGFAGRSGKT